MFSTPSNILSSLPLELDCYDEEEGNLSETGRESDNDEVATSEAEEPPYNKESTLIGHDSPITLGVNSASAGPLTRSQSPAADMQLSGLQETPVSQSADHLVSERDSQPPTHPSSVGATPNTLSMMGALGSQQPPSVSQELATHEDTAQSDESSTHHLPRRAAA